jgi:hypothetical protein
MSRTMIRFAFFAAAALAAAGCAGSDGGGNAGSTGNAGATGGSGSSGSTGSPGGTDGGAGNGGAGGASNGGAGGASGTGGVKDGGIAGGGSGGGGIAGGGTSGGGTGGGACPSLPAGTCTPPADIACPYPKLSKTGCLDANPFSDPKIPLKMASVVVPYEVNSPLWSDGAAKTRGLRLPTGGKIHVKDCTKNPTECGVLDPATLKCCLPPADDGKWVFPAGTVMVKNFMFQDSSRPSGYKLVETRLFVRMDHVVQLQGVKTEWVGYAYQWDDAQTDATVVGTTVDGSDTGVSAMFHVTPMGAAAKTITWNYPSRNDCITCHKPITPTTVPASGYTLGPETVQMNRTATGDTMNQIDKLAALGLFDMAPAKPYKAALLAPYGPGSPTGPGTLDQRARSYMHANCSFCHRPDGVWNGFDVRYDVPFKSASICNAVPGKGDLGVAGATLLTPNDATRSLIWLRMNAPAGNDMTGGTGRMPAIASSVVDAQGTDLIKQWINSVTACP